MTLKLKSTINELWKGWKLVWYHHFTHVACTKKLRVTTKTGSTSCTKQTISFEVSRFRTKTHLLQRDFIFFELIWTPLFFCAQNAPFEATSSIYKPYDYICYFSCIYWLFWAIRPWNWKEFEMNSEKVPSWHGIIISPT